MEKRTKETTTLNNVLLRLSPHTIADEILLFHTFNGLRLKKLSSYDFRLFGYFKNDKRREPVFLFRCVFFVLREDILKFLVMSKKRLYSLRIVDFGDLSTTPPLHSFRSEKKYFEKGNFSLLKKLNWQDQEVENKSMLEFAMKKDIFTSLEHLSYSENKGAWVLNFGSWSKSNLQNLKRISIDGINSGRNRKSLIENYPFPEMLQHLVFNVKSISKIEEVNRFKNLQHVVFDFRELMENKELDLLLGLELKEVEIFEIRIVEFLDFQHLDQARGEHFKKVIDQWDLPKVKKAILCYPIFHSSPRIANVLQEMDLDLDERGTEGFIKDTFVNCVWKKLTKIRINAGNVAYFSPISLNSSNLPVLSSLSVKNCPIKLIGKFTSLKSLEIIDIGSLESDEGNIKTVTSDSLGLVSDNLEKLHLERINFEISSLPKFPKITSIILNLYNDKEITKELFNSERFPILRNVTIFTVDKEALKKKLNSEKISFNLIQKRGRRR